MRSDMKKTSLSRRELLILPAIPLGLRAAARQGGGLQNAALGFEVELTNGKVSARRLANRLADERVDLPNEDFELEFDNDLVVTPSALTATLTRKTSTQLELMLSGGSGALDGVQVRVQYELQPGKAYLHKQIFVRQARGGPRRLLRADLENWQGVKRNWDSMHADRLPRASHPIFCETLWAGVEFVAAFNEYSNDGFVLRSRPGGKAVGSDWLPLHSTVIGAAEPQTVRDAFLRYLEDVRLAPPRLVACYNSWWTLPHRIPREEHVALARELADRMHRDQGVFFDIFVTDEGWTDPQSIWEINRKYLPDGFADIRSIVESAGGKLGLWMSPSEVYPYSIDYEWADKNGYVTIKPHPVDRRRGISLACPKYRKAINEELKKLIRENGFEHIKFDGFIAQEDVPHDGLLPGQDSIEPLAEYCLELLRSAKEANPNLVTEPTCLNSGANYISPWIIKYSDTVWGNSGGDCPLGVGPAPDYRESHTNGREYYIFSSLREFWLPQNTVQYFDIVHCDEGKGFPNHAAMAFGRGRFFIPTYVNPKFMTQDDWRIYAGLLGWARKNREILRNTVVLPSRVEIGEPYVYGHWLGSRGILAVRNPSNETRQFAIELGKTGAPKQLSDAVCYTQYPYRKGIAAGLSGRATLPVTLAPWELLFLEIVPRAELAEPVAIGARWYRGTSGAMSLAPDSSLDRVRVFQPQGTEQAVTVQTRAPGNLRGEVLAQTVKQVPEGDWLQAQGKRLPTVAFDVECSVSVSPGKGRVLLLLQFPGREREQRPSNCRATVNGAAVTLQESSSGGHVGYYGPNTGVWEGIRPYDSQWTWYICEVAGGASRVQFSGMVGHPQCRMGLWAWRESELAADPAPVPIVCSEPAMPPYNPGLERQGICLKAPVSG